MPRKAKRNTRRRTRTAGGDIAMGNPSNTFKNERVAHSGLSASPSGVVGGFADREIVTLRYVQGNLLTSTTGAYATQLFRGNSVYDPDDTGAGAQPANFDDFATRYNRYRVLASRISVMAVLITGNGGPLVVHPWNATNASSMNSAIAQPYAVANQVSTNHATTVNYITTGKILGRTQAQVLGSDSCAAVINTNPGDVWYWTVGFEPMDATTTSTIQIRTVLDYTVIFYDRVTGGLDFHIERLLSIKAALRSRAEKAKYSNNVERKELADDPHTDAPETDLVLVPMPRRLVDPKEMLRTPGNIGGSLQPAATKASGRDVAATPQVKAISGESGLTLPSRTSTLTRA